MTDDLTRAQRSALATLIGSALPPIVAELGRRFEAAGHQIYLVGGQVRDLLLGRPGEVDLDFTTDARPEQTLAIAEAWGATTWETGAAFGTIGLTKAGHKLEITTFRSDRYDPQSRKPEVTYGESLEVDLGRRDFTVNAMAFAVPGGEFIDPFGGLADCRGRLLRTPGTAEASFGDDPLRMLRAARFASQLGFELDPEAIRAMGEMAERIEIVSAERISAELSKLLVGDDPVRGIRLLVDTGLADHFLPEIPALRMTTDPIHRHKDVYEHSLMVLSNAMALEQDGPDLTLRMAALLHDIGKPRTRAFESGGVVTFHHHEVVGAKMARKRLRELKFPKAFIDDVSTLIDLHLRFHGYADSDWTDSAVRRYVTDAGPLVDRLNKLVRSDCTTRNRRKADLLSFAMDDLESRIAVLAEQEELAKIRPALDGNQIMAILGVAPGPEVGKAYKYLLGLRMERGPMEPEEAERELRAWAAANGIA